MIESMTASLAQQCTRDGLTGSFLYQGESHKTGALVSPIFPDTADLFRWCQKNRWVELPGSYAGKYYHSI